MAYLDNMGMHQQVFETLCDRYICNKDRLGRAVRVPQKELLLKDILVFAFNVYNDYYCYGDKCHGDVGYYGMPLPESAPSSLRVFVQKAQEQDAELITAQALETMMGDALVYIYYELQKLGLDLF